MDEKTCANILKKMMEGSNKLREMYYQPEPADQIAWKIAADKAFPPSAAKYTPKEYADGYFKAATADILYKLNDAGMPDKDVELKFQMLKTRPMKIPSLDSLYEIYEKKISDSNKINWGGPVECSEKENPKHSDCILCDIEKQESKKSMKKIKLSDDNFVLSNAFKMISREMEKTLFSLIGTLMQQGAEAVISGGCFRNWMAGKNEKDIDIFIVKSPYKSEKQTVEFIESQMDIEFTQISSSSSEYDEEFFVYEGVVDGFTDIDRCMKVQLIFIRNFSDPKAFIETFDFDINKGFAEIVDGKWNVSVEPVMNEIMNKTLTLNYSTIDKYEWRTKRLVARSKMIQEQFPDHKIVIV